MEIGFCNKNELVKEVAKKIETGSVKMAHDYVNAVFEVISEQILDGKSVNINGIGKFEPFIKQSGTYVDLAKKDSNGKLLRNADGSPMTKTVPERYGVRFKMINSFKNKVKAVPLD